MIDNTMIEHRGVLARSIELACVPGTFDIPTMAEG